MASTHHTHTGCKSEVRRVWFRLVSNYDHRTPSIIEKVPKKKKLTSSVSSSALGSLFSSRPFKGCDWWTKEGAGGCGVWGWGGGGVGSFVCAFTASIIGSASEVVCSSESSSEFWPFANNLCAFAFNSRGCGVFWRTKGVCKTIHSKRSVGCLYANLPNEINNHKRKKNRKPRSAPQNFVLFLSSHESQRVLTWSTVRTLTDARHYSLHNGTTILRAFNLTNLIRTLNTPHWWKWVESWRL